MAGPKSKRSVADYRKGKAMYERYGGLIESTNKKRKPAPKKG